MKRFIRNIILATLPAAAALLAPSAASASDAVRPAGAFAWGAEVGGGIDMTSNDLSTVNIDAFFGYRNRWLRMAGIGAGINMMVNDSYRCFPVYATFQINFRRRPSVVYLDLRAGCVFNNLGGNRQQTSFYGSPGLGFNLAGGPKFQSYLVLAYVYNGMRPFDNGLRHIDIHGLHQATVRLGITF
ncbi:MAG: hypothetical protein NC336_06820 [Clostridium sp.]|nr:hypothetical protein [Clostridium sp.]